MDILQKITTHKKAELEIIKQSVPEHELRNSSFFNRQAFSLKNILLSGNTSGIIAEFKRKSPSRGFINKEADVFAVTSAYTKFGASGLSVLTDEFFFGGNTEDILNARANKIPILRKDFIIDPYQVLASKAMGADVILLIAACLSVEEVKMYAHLAKKLGMEVILEIHDQVELDHLCSDIDMVGINNRNLKTFEVDINHSIALSKLIPEGIVKIAESGIDEAQTIRRFKEEGYQGFLAGEVFMRSAEPGNAFRDFVEKL